MKKIIEALGYKWTFSENSELADLERREMGLRANDFAFAHKKPSEASFIYNLLRDNYADIMSSLEDLEGGEGNDEGAGAEELKLNLTFSPLQFFEFAKKVYQAGNYAEIRKLRQAAVECNPHWNPEPPLTDAPAEVAEAAAAIEEAQGLIDLDNPSDEAVDPDAVLEASATVVDFAEVKAKKEGGKVGPATFPATASKRQRK